MNDDQAVTVRERIGSAVNTTNLSPDKASSTLVAALGTAAMMRAGTMGPAGPCMQVTAVGTPVLDPRRRLASLLQRAKLGHDRAALGPAVLLFARWIARHNDYAHKWKLADGESMSIKFAAAVISEWMHAVCTQCGGTGRELASEPGRNARTRACALCNGAGRVPPRASERAHMLNITVDTYTRHWIPRFRAAHTWLAAIEGSNIQALKSQLKSGTLPS